MVEIVAAKFPKLENGAAVAAAAAFPPNIDDGFSDLVGVVNDDIEKIFPPPVAAAKTTDESYV